MNIEIANRLVKLRKQNNLSQEGLAEKLGISRQAVSKWERAEASPDTDNLILLARLYGISLDELLKTEDEIPRPDPEQMDNEKLSGSLEYMEPENFGDGKTSDSGQEDYVHVGFQGVHVKDKNGEVHVGWDGIHVDDKNQGDNVHIDKSGVYVNGQKYDKEWFSHHHHFPMWIVITILYLIIGVIWNAWHPGWLLFLFVPIWYSLVEAIYQKNPNCFAYPIFVTLIYLSLGFFWFLWHPGWVVFLTIPLYYPTISWLRECRERDRVKEERAGDANEE